MIPFIQPDLGEIEAKAAYDTIMSGFVNEGKLAKEFEKEFAKAAGVEYAIAVTSGTAALTVSLMALQIKDKEVIIPDLTMIGTAMAVLLSGNIPVVVDVKPSDGCIDPRKVKEAVGKNTTAIIPVHLNGRNAIDSALSEVAEEYNLAIIEDAACCMGSIGEDGAQLGTVGSFGCFSLAATKIITSGQGGVIVTNDAELYEKAVRLKDWGRFENKGTYHPEIGFNFKFTDIQAAIALKQLERLPELVKRKREIYERYKSNLGELIFSKVDHSGFCPWYVDIKGQELTSYLSDRDVKTSPIWPALHQQGAMKLYGENSKYSVAAELVKEILWLPSSTKLKNEEIDYICDLINKR